MITYIGKIQRQLIKKYGFKENPGKPGIPLRVPDGEYPMKIDGKLDRVRITKGKISCCNFEKKQLNQPAKIKPGFIPQSIDDESFSKICKKHRLDRRQTDNALALIGFLEGSILRLPSVQRKLVRAAGDYLALTY